MTEKQIHFLKSFPKKWVISTEYKDNKLRIITDTRVYAVDKDGICIIERE